MQTRAYSINGSIIIFCVIFIVEPPLIYFASRELPRLELPRTTANFTYIMPMNKESKAEFELMHHTQEGTQALYRDLIPITISGTISNPSNAWPYNYSNNTFISNNFNPMKFAGSISLS